jgi:glycerophosphoryl diester phosphodiesterase
MLLGIKLGEIYMTINYAHRGASGDYPENTMLAFEKAIEMGCGGIETDVHVTKDGCLVLIHDETIDRTSNGKGYISDFTLEELKQFDAGSWKGEAYSGLTIPSIDELLMLVKDKDLIINLELKTDVIQYQGIEEKVINKIYEYGVESKVIISSFNHYTVRRCKDIDKDIKIGLLYMEGLYEPQMYADIVGAEAIHPYYHTVDNDQLVERIRKSNIEVNVWTVNDEAAMKRFLQFKVHGIITNYPDKLKKIMKG